MKTEKKKIILIVFLLCGYAFAGQTIYVDADASGGGDGSSWATAYNFLQDALANANSSAKPVEIWVSEGIYKPDQGAGITPGDRYATFQLIDGVAIKGGYAGFGEPDPNSRDIELYETILTGDLVGNDVDVNDPMDLLYEPTRVDNSYHVLTGSGIDASAVLDGFTITAGHAQSNKYGGGMYNYNGSPTMLNCKFTKNWAEDNGGGMYNSSSNPLLVNCKFTFNATSEDDDDEGGSGIFNDSSSTILVNCVFIGNWADFRGGGMYNKYSNPTLTNCTFSDNWAEMGGAIYNYRDTDEEDYSPTLTNCTFSGNSADTGGAMYNRESSTTLTNCTFSVNLADNNGGGMYNYKSNPTVTNLIFWGNIDIGGVDETAQIYNHSSATPAINYCCVQGWTGTLGGIGNIGDDPLFVDADGIDNIVGTEDDNLRLLAGSPCIDAGDNSVVTVTTDLDGNQRIINGIVDMGAYEAEYYGPIAHWKFDEGTGSVAYDSAGDNDGNIYGVQWTTGIIDGALDFDGDGDYVEFASIAALQGDSLTALAWIRVDEFAGLWNPILMQHDMSTTTDGYYFYIVNDRPSFYLVNGAIYAEATSLEEINADQWYHVAGTNDGSSLKLYVNGRLEGSASSSSLTGFSYNAYIGCDPTYPLYYNGLIDDVRIYDRALSAAEIEELYNSVPVPPVGETYHVDGVNGDNSNDGLSRETAFETIQFAIDEANDFDTILVWPGVYNEEISFWGDAITVKSTADAAIVETDYGYAFSFFSAEGPDTILSNFVIRNSQYGIYLINGASPTLRNLTIVNNDFGISAFNGADPDISNCIFWNNFYGDLFRDPVTLQARYSCIEEGGEGEGNISIEPGFVDANSGDYHLLSERGRYWPAHNVWVLDDVTSPCIDGGDPTIDPSNERMPNGGRINMGAYGNTAYASMSDWPLKHDSNFDGVVNMLDFAELALEWLETTPVIPEPNVLDTLPPLPDPMQWDDQLDANGYDGRPLEVYLELTGDYGATMRAIDADDQAPTGGIPNEVEYYFYCVNYPEEVGKGGFSSGWRTVGDYPDETVRRTYTVRIGTSGQALQFKVKARDTSASKNETEYSESYPAVYRLPP